MFDSLLVFVKIISTNNGELTATQLANINCQQQTMNSDKAL